MNDDEGTGARFEALSGILGLVPRLIFIAISLIALSGCAGRPIVKGFFEPGGTIYREPEQEEWGSRSTLKIRGLDF